jgi:HK97 gp10 family phage protein
MSLVTITIRSNTKQARARLQDIRARIEHGAGDVVEWAKHRIENSAKDSLLEGKSGVQYPRLPNRSSAPGEAPANQFGGLSAGIVGKMISPLRARVSSGAFYAGYLEYGTSKMGARPHMEPALRKTEPEFISRIISMIQGA